MPHPNRSAPLARGRRQIRITAEELHVREDVTRVYRQLTDAPAGRLKALAGGRATTTLGHRIYAARQREKGQGAIERVALELIALRTLPAELAASEAELRLIPQYLTDLIERLSCGDSVRAEAELVLEEGRLEARENRRTDELLVLGVSPARLLAAAAADDQEAAILQERARARRIRARQLERGAA